MIITTVMGGLGNQLFQYAVGRSVALRTGRPLRLDVTRMPSPAGGALRRLQVIELPGPGGTPTLRRPGRQGLIAAPSRWSLRVDHVVRTGLARWTVTEPETEDVLVDLSDPPGPIAVLFGYWQSHRYHAGAEDVLRAELTPPVARGGRVAAMLDRLARHEVVTVHVRRGDYVTDPHLAAEFGAPSTEYLRRALDLVLSRCDAPAVVVLTDDPPWAAEHVRADAPVHHVELDAPLDPIEALALMSRGRHTVIANSSLSWWGARLAEHPDQVVVAPTPWYAGRPSEPSHRLPERWVRLPR